MKIYLGTDHAGFELKEKIKAFLKTEINCEIEDYGAFEFDEFDDYPDFIFPVAKKVAEDWKNGTENFGIIFGGSGQGEAMVANRIQGVRATVFYGGPEEIVKLSREHNNANVLSLGARFVNFKEVKEIIKLWLDTKFSGEERHERRIDKIDL
ncbi:MAG: RpiB/LacA/LacB family sugar-phosphate isomerase [Candidatus Moranbacteria bacterium]|nr:RpiB/LacA/LacB family sugar-phosphate isomerase [Candidatus Moranbacteria bacterium]